MRDYKKIKAYILADEMVFEVYKLTRKFPKEELYGLVSQIRRAAVSVPANIVEGANRQTHKDYLNFLYISRGSLAELEYLLMLSVKLNFLQTVEYDDLKFRCESISKTLLGLIRSVASEV